MAVLLAFGAAVGWGASDFYGGVFGRDMHVFLIVAGSELVGLALLTPVLVARGVPLPHDPRLLLAGVAGVAVTLELSLVYLALSRGEAFITAPIGALGAATAAVAGLLAGDPLTATIAAGMLCALLGAGASAWTSGSSSDSQTTLRGALTCSGAAAGVATMLICLHAAGRADPYWAAAVEHASTAVSAGAIALASSAGTIRRGLCDRRQLAGLGLIGVTGTGGDLAYVVSSQHGALSIVSAVSSLYPTTTLALAFAIQRQRARRLQTVGIVLALAGAAVLGTAAR